MGIGYISWQPGGYGGTACFNPKTVAGTFIYPGLGWRLFTIDQSLSEENAIMFSK